MTGSVAVSAADLPRPAPGSETDLGQTLMPGFYAASGDLSLSGMLVVWAIASLIAVPLVLTAIHMRPALRPQRCGLLALAIFWPFPAMVLLAALPILIIRAMIGVLDWASPAWIPIIEGTCLMFGYICRSLRDWIDPPDPYANYRPGCYFHCQSILPSGRQYGRQLNRQLNRRSGRRADDDW